MDYLYFACDWIIQRVTYTQAEHLFRTAGILGCEIVEKGMRRTEKGYIIGIYAIQTPSISILEEFVQKAVSLEESVVHSITTICWQIKYKDRDNLALLFAIGPVPGLF